MPANQPFEANVKTGVTGQTITISASNVSQNNIIDSTNNFSSAILVTVQGPQTSVAYVRLSAESSTVITATTTDVPMPGGPNPCVRLFANPSPAGKTAVAVITTVAVSVSPVTVWFTPGNSGIA